MFKNVSDRVTAWHKIGAPPYMINWITEGIPLQFYKVPRQLHLQNPKFSVSQIKFIDAEIKELLQKGAVRKCKAGEVPWCVSPIKTVPKKHRKLRLIIDLREINKCIDVPKFSQENIEVVANLIEPQDHIITTDLKDGFHHCKIHPDFHKYLGFYYKGDYYVWQALPFGLKSSPYHFNKFLRPVVQYLREIGLRIVFYVDDAILLMKHAVVADHKDLLLHTLEDLGIAVNFEKSSLNPSYTKEYLGFIIDSSGDKGYPIIQIKKDRIKKLKKDIKHVLKCTVVKAKKLAQIAGQCISMTRAILPGKLLLRNVYRLLKTKTSWDDTLTLDNPARKDIVWWSHAIDNWNGAPIKLRPIDIQIETDASSHGWGAIVRDHEASGLWNRRICHLPSNTRELLAIHMAVLSFKDQLKDKCVQVLSDNVTACAYINNLGGPSPELTRIATSLWITCYELGIDLRAKFLAGINNYKADRLSRPKSPYEWRLRPSLFTYIDNLFGPHTIDHFVSMTSTHLAKYIIPSTGIHCQQGWMHLLKQIGTAS